MDVDIRLEKGTVVEEPVHLCFGVTDRRGVQQILLNIEIEENAEIGILAHCIFPRAVDVKHIMDANISVGKGAKYTYLEKHIHSPEGGIEVIPKAKVELGEKSRFKTDFELLKGRAGKVDIDYETVCGKDSVMEMTAKVDGKGDDKIDISETGKLVGRGDKRSPDHPGSVARKGRS